MNEGLTQQKSIATHKWKRYPKYKDSGVEWLGEVPEPWEILRIALAVEKITNGYVGPTKDILVDNGVKYLQSLHIKNGEIRFEKPFFVTQEWNILHSKSLLAEDDILVVQTGDLGQCAVVPKEYTGCNCHALIILRVRKKVGSGKYFGFFLRSEYGKNKLLQACEGATLPHLECGKVREIPIIIPSIPEQNQIIEYLKSETTSIDALIAKKEQQIDLLKEKWMALINHAVTKGLNPNIQMKSSGVEWIGKMPEHWVITKLRRFCRLQQGLQIPQNERYFEPSENRLEYITIKSIHAGENFLNKEYIDNPQKRVICYPDDILFARTGGTGEIVTNQTGAFHNNFFKVIYDKKNISKEFLIYYLQNPLMTQYFTLMAGTTTIPDLNHDEFLDAPFTLPYIDEQNTIVQLLNNEREIFENCERMIHKSITILNEYRTALISAAVTGKIDVWQEISA